MDGDVETKFKQVLTATWSILKAAGYSKRGSRFRLARDNNIAMIDFQRSTENSAKTLKFTVNLVVISGEAMRRWDPEKDLSKASIWDAHLQERIGVIVANEDRWWTITPYEPVSAIEAEISHIVEMHAIPFLERYARDTDLIALWRTGRSPGLTEGQRVRNLAFLEDAT